MMGGSKYTGFRTRKCEKTRKKGHFFLREWAVTPGGVEKGSKNAKTPRCGKHLSRPKTGGRFLRFCQNLGGGGGQKTPFFVGYPPKIGRYPRLKRGGVPEKSCENRPQKYPPTDLIERGVFGVRKSTMCTFAMGHLVVNACKKF